jgi:hypothetical protein
MGRKSNARFNTRRPQASKRDRTILTGTELDLMVRFTASRDRDREGMGR